MLKLFQRFQDDKLIECAQHALDDNPSISIRNLDVSSKRGIVTISGHAQSNMSTQRAVDAVTHAFAHAGLKYQKVVDGFDKNIH